MEIVDNAVGFVSDNKNTIAIGIACAVLVLAAWLYFKR